MIHKSDIEAALDSCGYPWREPSYAPAKAPAPPYILLRDRLEFNGPDLSVGYVGHETRILLYDGGGPDGNAAREKVTTALAETGAHFTQYPSDYNYDLKLFETEYWVNETYYEKWSE